MIEKGEGTSLPLGQRLNPLCKLIRLLGIYLIPLMSPHSSHISFVEHLLPLPLLQCYFWEPANISLTKPSFQGTSLSHKLLLCAETLPGGELAEEAYIDHFY